MIRSEESKRLWVLAEAERDFDAMDKIEAEWAAQAEPEPHIDYPGDDEEIENAFWDERGDSDWTDEDEAALEEHEEAKRRRIAEQNEY